MTEPTNQTPSRFDRYNRWFRWTVFGIVASMFVLIFAIGFSDLPSFDELENPKYDLASVIYDVNGKSFGRYYIEDRVSIDFEQLSPHVKKALLVTEDERFYDHNGIDFRDRKSVV